MHRLLVLVLRLGLCVFAATATAQGQAPALTPLRVLAFDGGWNLPMWVAQRKGLFEAQGSTCSSRTRRTPDSS